MKYLILLATFTVSIGFTQTARLDFINGTYNADGSVTIEILDTDQVYRLGTKTSKVLMTVDTKASLNYNNDEDGSKSIDAQFGIGYPIYDSKGTTIGAYLTLAGTNYSDPLYGLKVDDLAYGAKVFISFNKQGDSVAVGLKKVFGHNFKVLKVRADIGLSQKWELESDFNIVWANDISGSTTNQYERSNFTLSGMYNVLEANSANNELGLAVGPTFRAYTRKDDVADIGGNYFVGGTLKIRFGR